MGRVDRQTTKSPAWPYLASLGSGLFLSFLALVWLPWERVHPADASLRESLGYAPLWSHRFDGITGAHIDWNSFFISLFVIWILCIVAAFMLKMSSSHE